MINEKVIVAIVAVLQICLSVWGGSLYGRADERAKANARAVEIQQENDRLAQKIAERENQVAEQASRAERAEQERIDAIKTNSHQTKEIARLQKLVDSRKDRDAKYIILDVDAYKRMREAVRRGGQAKADPANSVSADISAIEGYRYLPDPACLWRRNPQDHEGRRSRLSRMSQAI